MSTNERMKILEMISEGQVTAEEGARLLDSVGAGTPVGKPQPAPAGLVAAPGQESTPTQGAGNSARNRRLRVKVVEEGGTKVNVNLPLSLMEVGLKIGGRFVDELKDMDSEMQMLLEAIQQDVTGKIVEVDDADSHVEIFIE